MPKIRPHRGTAKRVKVTATGKVLKHELRKDIERRLEQEAAQAEEVASAT